MIFFVVNKAYFTLFKQLTLVPPIFNKCKGKITRTSILFIAVLNFSKLALTRFAICARSRVGALSVSKQEQ